MKKHILNIASEQEQPFQQIATYQPNTDVCAIDLGDAIGTLKFTDSQAWYNIQGVVIFSPKPYAFGITEMDDESLNDSQKIALDFFKKNKQATSFFKKKGTAIIYSAVNAEHGIEHVFTSPSITYDGETLINNSLVCSHASGINKDIARNCAYDLDARVKLPELTTNAINHQLNSTFNENIAELYGAHIRTLVKYGLKPHPQNTFANSAYVPWVHNDKIYDKHIKIQQELLTQKEHVA
jgi:hypothetical protein